MGVSLATSLAKRDLTPTRPSHTGGLLLAAHPIATFLVLVYATTTALVFVPKWLTEPGLLPGGATPHGVLENVLGRLCQHLSLPPW